MSEMYFIDRHFEIVEILNIVSTRIVGRGNFSKMEKNNFFVDTNKSFKTFDRVSI